MHFGQPDEAEDRVLEDRNLRAAPEVRQSCRCRGASKVDSTRLPAASSVSVTIDASSIDTGVSDRDDHLRSADLFDVDRYPEITFESKEVSGALEEGGELEIVGDLTMHGVTREVTLDAAFDGTGTDPWGGTRSGFAAKTRIDRRDFGLGWNQALETGGVLVGHDIEISLQVQAVLEQEPAAV